MTVDADDLPPPTWRPQAAHRKRVIVLTIACGGALGALARFTLGGWIATWAGVGFPWATFLANASGSLLLGVLNGTRARDALSLPRGRSRLDGRGSMPEPGWGDRAAPSRVVPASALPRVRLRDREDWG